MDIELDWQNAAADLDLQIAEPGAATINKNNLQGDFGKIYEDITAGGARSEKYETKFANNANLTGDYAVSVNYFSG